MRSAPMQGLGRADAYSPRQGRPRTSFLRGPSSTIRRRSAVRMSAVRIGFDSGLSRSLDDVTAPGRFESFVLTPIPKPPPKFGTLYPECWSPLRAYRKHLIAVWMCTRDNRNHNPARRLLSEIRNSDLISRP